MESLISSPNLVSDIQYSVDIPTDLHQQLVDMVPLVQAQMIMNMFQLLLSLRRLFYENLCFQFASFGSNKGFNKTHDEEQ